MIMATYGAWLKSGADRADQVGELARWVMANTSRLGSPASIASKINELASEEDGTRARLAAAHVAAKAEYDGQRGSARPRAAVPPPGQELPPPQDAGLPGMQSGAETAAGAAPGDGEPAPAWTGEVYLTGSSHDDLDRIGQAMGLPPYQPPGFTGDDRELLLLVQRRVVWLELALRTVLGEQRAAEIDSVLDAVLGPPQTDLVAAYATAEMGE